MFANSAISCIFYKIIIQILIEIILILRELYQTEIHNYTVNDISFGLNDNLLVSASKDRQLSIHVSLAYLESNPNFIPEAISKMKIQEFFEANKKVIDSNDLRDKRDYLIPIFSKEVHTRLIYSVDFSFDGEFIVTGSRDKHVKVFVFEREGKLDFKEVFKKKLGSPVTSVQFLPGCNEVILFGLANGRMGLVSWKSTEF